MHTWRDLVQIDWQNSRFKATAIKHWASIGPWVFGAGLFFFGTRAMQINPLSFGAPKWLVGSIVAVIFAAARCVAWWRTVYPAERAHRLSTDCITCPTSGAA